MAEYIERRAAIEHLNVWCSGCGSAVECILAEPAADVAPVVHGRWNNMDGYKTRKVCSECGWDVPEYGKFYSYCPNCGAKMDGGVDNETD